MNKLNDFKSLASCQCDLIAPIIHILIVKIHNRSAAIKHNDAEVASVSNLIVLIFLTWQFVT
jgi:hypothetical protein